MKLSFGHFLVVFFALILSGSCQKAIVTQEGTIKFTFTNTVNGIPMVLDGPAYTNPFGETYTITKFKYDISNTAADFNKWWQAQNEVKIKRYA